MQISQPKFEWSQNVNGGYKLFSYGLTYGSFIFDISSFTCQVLHGILGKNVA